MKKETAQKTEKQAHLPFFGIGKILPYLAEFKTNLILMISIGLLASGMDVIMPLFQQYSLNHFVKQQTMDTVLPFVGIYLFAILFSGVTNYISTVRATCTEVGVNRVLRNRLFHKMQTLSFSFFNQNSVGVIHSRIMSDTSKIGTLVSWTLFDFVWHTSYLIGSAVAMLMLNARLAAYVLVILPVLWLLFTFFRKKLRLADRKIREINSRITGNWNEGITGAKTVKSLAVEERIGNRFSDETESMRKNSVRASRLHGLFSATMTLASSVGIAVVLWKGGYIAKEQIGTFSAFMAYAQGMMEPVRWLIEAVSSLVTTQVNIERFSDLLATVPDVSDSPEVIEKYGDSLSPKRENWEPIRGDIELCDVTFCYPDGNENVLEHFSLSIPFGTHLAIVGETGAGKSTLVNLICRFFEPTAGRILMDGRDIRERSQLWLHDAIGYVLQTPHLFSGTVLDNLLMGKPDATDAEIAAALHAVSADEVVNRLEKGLLTDVGENGDLLSTGEKQLISFARAVLSDPKLLILDEATASVDTLTEQKIQSALETVTAGRTSIMIAHRLSTVKNADIILVVKNGKIVESGTHRELIARHGTYYDLYFRQFREEQTARILE